MKLWPASKTPELGSCAREPRAGKTSALNMAVSEAKGEILVFPDANRQMVNWTNG
jgi:hypothetical protein